MNDRKAYLERGILAGGLAYIFMLLFGMIQEASLICGVGVFAGHAILWAIHKAKQRGR